MSAPSAFAAYQKAAAPLPALICDTDDTVCFEAETVCSVLNAQFGLTLDATRLGSNYHPLVLPKGKHMNKWLRQWRQDPNSYINRAPDYEAFDALNALRGDGWHLTMASDRPAAALAITTNWYDTWGLGYDAVAVNGDGTKAALVAGHGPDNPCILIDDDQRNLLSLPRPGVQVWSPRRPWTPASVPPGAWVFESWTNLMARIATISHAS